VIELSYAGVALRAKQPTYYTSLVTVINREPSILLRLLADPADVVLLV
jgi:hypothetical protein